MRFFSLAILSLISILFISCNGSNTEEVNSDEDSLSSEQVQVTDMQPHSYANLQEVRTTHLHLDLTADFDTQTLSGSVTHSIKNARL